MRMCISPGDNGVEITPTVLKSPEAVDRWIKALQIAKQVVWPKEKTTEKKP